MTQIHICAVGRLKKSPEQALIDEYQTRFNRHARALGFDHLNIKEVEDKKAQTKAAEAALLEKSIPKGAYIFTLDERGKLMSSPDFSKEIAKLRDHGHADIVFLIGGADGLDPALRARADASLSFGQMVWPHMLARVMLSEQLYRALSILSNSPYHRV